MKNKQILKNRKIAGILKNRIIKGDYPFDSKIPSETVLSEEFKVSRPTIKSAIGFLVRDGYISCLPSIGSFVIKKSGAKRIIGYVSPDLSDPFHVDMISNLEKITSSKGIGLIIASSGESREEEISAIERVIKNGAAGVLVSKSISSSDIETKYKIPLVWTGGVSNDSLYDKVTINNQKGIQQIIDHLMSLGARTFAYAEAEKGRIENSQRYLTFKAYLEKQGIKIGDNLIFKTDERGQKGGFELFKSMIKTGLPDAIVCYNDWTAFGIIEGAIQHKIKVPEQLKVSGFDNILLSSYFKVPLTTINYKAKLIAQTAVEILLGRIEGSKGKIKAVIVEPELIIRESTRKG
ncbi:MAG: GntR family transcriptional regulator [Elusimicrobia bacterium]|nr:GntR family transcriptional regulator [Elusimicrobiota bacterium]MBU2614284.1 GntR family transcriptional regulator [Elusimicrobiota bacterium]